MTGIASPSAYLTGLILGGSLIIAIGAQNAFVLRQGLLRAHVALVVMLCVLIDVVLTTVGVGGLSASLGRNPLAIAALAIAGACFLGWYGLGAARRACSSQSLAAAPVGAAQSARGVLLQTLAVSLLNPHVYLDTVMLIGSVGVQQPASLRPAFLAGVWTASCGWFASLGFGSRLLAPVFARPIAWRVLDALVALVMWGIALTLLWTTFR
ncbi:MAG TPA: LysE/ArgO family amino acid transporter [Steroidobacteraceae bacterium]|jgi:L-lysine exporter family protein LysE/ArgO|nr:LysE/ArgO family amino acid transporter [Steroidobacteraceae bacterium]